MYYSPKWVKGTANSLFPGVIAVPYCVKRTRSSSEVWGIEWDSQDRNISLRVGWDVAADPAFRNIKGLSYPHLLLDKRIVIVDSPDLQTPTAEEQAPPEAHVGGRALLVLTTSTEGTVVTVLCPPGSRR